MTLFSLRLWSSVIVLMLILLAVPISASSQHQETSEKPGTWKGQEHDSPDSTSLLHAFKSGTMNGHFRYFFMATDNEPGLTDYYANAAGGGIRYQSGSYHGFSTTISGFYVFNVGSSDLGMRDSTTGQANRYESTLFDIEDPYNRGDIDRLEELQLNYSVSATRLQFGRMLINTPFINLQDGRMRPTGVEGFWFRTAEWKALTIEGGYLYSFSPRGTTRWFRMGSSIGVYPGGFSVDGSRSEYADNVQSRGVGVLGINWQLNKNLKIQVWDVLIENVLNSALLQADLEVKAGAENDALYIGAQFIRQDAMGNGGNEDTRKAYAARGSKSMTMGGRIGWKNPDIDLSVNYNRITAHGRYLFPREWGRDPFFTFLPRERNEGFGDSHALVFKATHSFRESGWKASLGAGRIWLPDVRDARLNKYAMPSFDQVNLDLRYDFSGFLNGLDLQFLAVGKLAEGETYGNKSFIINKVNMILYNLVLNYHF